MPAHPPKAWRGESRHPRLREDFHGDGLNLRDSRPFVRAVKNVLEDLELVEDFVQEATERIESASDQALEAEQGDEEAWLEMKREIHSLKGAAGFLGLDRFGDLCHELEDYLERVSPKEAGEEFDAVHVAFDVLADMVGAVQLAANQGTQLVEDKRVAALLTRLCA